MILQRFYGAVQRRARRRPDVLRKWRPSRIEPGMHESFSQCGEDMILMFLFGALGISVGTYVDIGANHPSIISNTFAFYKKGWRGTNIDPLKENISLFDAVRPEDNNLACGVGREPGTRKFYHMDADTLSTFDYDTAMSYAEQGHHVQRVTDVPVVTVSGLISSGKIPGSVELLSIDIEGGELDIISEFLNNAVRPKVITCETAFYSKDIRSMRKNDALIEGIRRLGYQVYADTRVNTIFVEPDLASENIEPAVSL